jgi:MFS transporter, putative metabolite:H+ symporter
MTSDDKSPGFLIARDRIPIWSLPGLFVGLIGVGFLFTFYDIFDINVWFIQTCSQMVPNCDAHSAANYIGLPVLLNLVGCVIGTLVVSPLADGTVGLMSMLVRAARKNRRKRPCA